ncbi:sodium-dependent phosphate transporter [Hepatocystis sp. ex Piliocolobus tephrosceles]|nr:sodium-dependent phosphate transporter [Hepatocystis sp. ex Piliocolobus tephrosceles]
MINYSDTLWLVIASGVACFFMAFVTGANDIANTFSTSIGSKSLSIKKALCIAFIFEALGASLLGGTVTDSIRSKIINFETFYDAPEFLMLGMLSALLGASIWLATATYIGLPVSTTHSIVGALLGFGLCSRKSNSIIWIKINGIIISWFAAPLLAGFSSAMTFITLRRLILRKKNSFHIIKRWYWILIFLITLPFSTFVVFQNPIVFNVECVMKKEDNIKTGTPCYFQDWASAHSFHASLICFILSSLLTIAGSIVIYYVYNKRLRSYSFRKKMFGDDIAMQSMVQDEKYDTICGVNNKSLNSVASTEPYMINSKVKKNIVSSSQLDNTNNNMKEEDKTKDNVINIPEINANNEYVENNKNTDTYKMNNNNVINIKNETTNNDCTINNDGCTINYDGYTTNNVTNSNKVNIQKSNSIKREQQNVEVFDTDTEIVFSSLQIISAILGVIAQSANDTANAIGPFAAVYNTYYYDIKEKIKVQWYILLFGGLSMSLGLSLLGYRVIKTVGMKLIKITPARGFTIELISGLVVLFFSICGFPLSSTHCAVSSVVGLGLVEAKIFDDDTKKVILNPSDMPSNESIRGCNPTNVKITNCSDKIIVDKAPIITTALNNNNDIKSCVKKKKKFPFICLNTSCVNLKLFRTIFLSWIITVTFSATVTAMIFSFATYSPSYFTKNTGVPLEIVPHK